MACLCSSRKSTLTRSLSTLVLATCGFMTDQMSRLDNDRAQIALSIQQGERVLLECYHLDRIYVRPINLRSYEPGGSSEERMCSARSSRGVSRPVVVFTQEITSSDSHMIIARFARPRVEQSHFFWDLPRGFRSCQGRKRADLSHVV